MIAVMNQQCHLSEMSESGLDLRISAALRRHLRLLIRLLKGAKLAVLMTILLHTENDGWAHLSLPFLERETGYRKKMIEKAVRGLGKQRVKGRRVLLVVRERRAPYLLNKDHYLLFPSEAEIARYENSLLEVPIAAALDHRLSGNS